MRKAFMGALCTLLLFTLTTCSQPRVEQIPPKVETTVIVRHELPKEKTVEPKPVEQEENYIDRDTMIREVVEVWNMFFEDGNVKQSDPRRDRFEEFAGYVADAVFMYQNNEVVIQGESALLPKHRSAHLLIAVIITKESSVRYDLVGSAPRFEVGLMQVHGVALNGYDPEVVKRNPKLGVLLGVRWFTYTLAQCRQHRMEGDDEGWRNTDWLGPLTIYGAKPSSAYKDRKNKVCRVFPHAKERVALLDFYETRIDAQNQQDLLLQ